MNKQYYVYIMANEIDTTLYIGITNDLKRRVYEHKEKMVDGFTKRYNINKLVYYEICQEVMGAISREKQLKGISRLKKNELIAQFNPYWQDLYEEL
jgi:putative endonuclease